MEERTQAKEKLSKGNKKTKRRRDTKTSELMKEK
jgi:hypothetical protein